MYKTVYPYSGFRKEPYVREGGGVGGMREMFITMFKSTQRNAMLVFNLGFFISAGVEIISPVCVRDDDESAVGDQFCETERPEEKTNECNTQRCPAR